tara:strand:+ start:1529 stop:2245 length:717 start_codon:yes stop_codon:yes gene_type:complete
MTNKGKKVIVFDLDETMGYFQNFGLFFYTLQNYLQQTITFEIFCNLLDLYPEILRPKIFSIFKFILNHKEYENIDIMIYTNNQGPKQWVQFIKSYFEYKLNSKIFSKIIYAFMINGKKIELNRTTHQKTYKDLLRTSKIPKSAKVCFIDDVYYETMEDDNVYYIHIEPYVSSLHYSTMVERLVKSKLITNLNEKYLLKNMSNAFSNVKFFKKNNADYEMDIIIGKKILSGLQDFFQNF